MDQIRVFPSPTLTTTLEVRGKRRVFIQGLPSRAACTIKLTICGDGTKLPPFIVLRSRNKNKWNQVVWLDGVFVTWQANAFTNNTTMLNWLKYVVAPYLQDRRGLIIFDSYACHTSLDVITDINRRGWLYEVIPKTCTPHVQPLDVSINKPVRTHLKKAYEDYVVRILEPNTGLSTLPCWSTCVIFRVWNANTIFCIVQEPSGLTRIPTATCCFSGFAMRGVVFLPSLSNSLSSCVV